MPTKVIDRNEKQKYILWFETTIDDEKKKEIEKVLSDLGIAGSVVDGLKAPTVVSL